MMLGVAGLFASCTSEDSLTPDVNGGQTSQLVLNLNADTDFKVQGSRALTESNYSNTDNYTVQIVKTDNDAVVMECKGSELSSNLPKTLDIGSYVVKAFYGTESAASRNDFRVEGSNTFTIKAEEQTTVSVNCTPTCGKLLVNFSDDMATYYSDYSVTYGGSTALGTNTIEWAKADTEPWYVAIGENGETLNYTISLTVNSDYAYVDANGDKQTQATVTGSFTLNRNRAHKLTIAPNYNPMTEGGLSITITIDESTNDKPVTIEVPVSWI